jgi:hypothetical protein
MFKDEYVNCPIENLKIRKVYGSDSLMLPKNFEWKEFEIEKSYKVIDFLNSYFSCHKFSNVYTLEHMKLILGKKNIILSIMKNEEIYGVIGGGVKNITIGNKTENFVEVKFICAHPRLRNKNISYVLIDEFIRRFVNKGEKYGYYLSEKIIESPIIKINIYERIINMDNTNMMGYTNKSVKIFNFSEDKKISEAILSPEQFKINEKPDEKYQLIDNKDLDVIYKLYNKYMSRFTFHTNLDLEEFKNYFGVSDIVKTYKIVNDKNEIIDFLSMSIQNIQDDGKILSTCTLNILTELSESVNRIIYNSVKIANQLKCDILYVNDIMNIGDVLLSRNVTDRDTGVFEFKFLKSPYEKYLHLFNWKSSPLINKQISLF